MQELLFVHGDITRKEFTTYRDNPELINLAVAQEFLASLPSGNSTEAD